MRSPVAVVEVVEGATEALPEDVRGPKSQAAVRTDGETGGVDGAGLGWLVELELVIGRDVAGAALRISQDTVAESDL